MRKIIHISDLHFGTEEPAIAEGLLKDIDQQNPALVVISGDFTQRARKSQFIKARNFLERIKLPQIKIPGNHDIPLFNIFKRFILPLDGYKKFITKDFFPLYEDNEIAVLGINTSRSLTWKNGKISVEQMEEIEKKLCAIDNNKFKVIVTHHPFIPPPGEPGIDLVGRSGKALNIIDQCDVDLLLAGHLHHGYSGDIRTFYPARKRSLISAQAGTAISNRIRNEPNAYNLITLERNNIVIEIRVWSGEKFVDSVLTIYRKENEEWIRED